MRKRNKGILEMRRNHKFMAEKLLYVNLGINILYAIFNAVCGIVLRSAWMGTMAFYYIWLSSLRLSLSKGLRNENALYQWKKYGDCGKLLLAFSIVLIGMSILIQTEEKRIEYPGYMIYGVAAYTFYSIIAAIRNIVKYRKWNHPIYSANKVLSFVTALISMFSLQAAMLTAFGDDPYFNKIMGIAVGFGVFIIIIAISVYMILRSRKQKNILKG